MQWLSPIGHRYVVLNAEDNHTMQEEVTYSSLREDNVLVTEDGIENFTVAPRTGNGKAKGPRVSADGSWC